jgi:FkbM family methyltransferase
MARVQRFLKDKAERLLPESTLRQLRVWKHRRQRARYPERIVRHRYGDRELEVIIGSQYGERYDHDWSELAEIAALKEGRLAPGALVFDLGASYGVIAMMLASAVTPGGRVIALEALPADAAIAQRNRDLNAVKHLEIVHAAVARTSGVVSFGHNGTVDDGAGRWGRISVPGWSIDDLAERYGVPDVVFIDIEGFEHQALLGAARVLQGCPDWFVEVHTQELGTYGTDSPRQVIECFDPERYDLFAAADRLALIPGAGVQSQTRFAPLAEQDPRVLEERFFLIARAKAA